MMWLIDLFTGDSVAHALMILVLVAALGVALGKIKILGVSLGIAGVLFTGIAAAHFNITVNADVLDFIRDFGLILFVYTIGFQVGPGFFATFKKQGLTINLLALTIVLLGVAMTLVIHLCAHVPMPVAVGIMSGAVTNTPGLGAAQQALKDIPNLPGEVGKMTSLSYAITYPFGVIGIILCMLLVYRLFKVDIQHENEDYARQRTAIFPPLAFINVQVKNPQLEGQSLLAINQVLQAEIVFSRMMRNNEVFTPLGKTDLHLGDILCAVGPKETLDKLKLLVGDEAGVDISDIKSNLVLTRVIVTRKKVLGRSLAELQLRNRYSVNITRVTRSGIEFVPHPGVHLHFGDVLTVVGENGSIQQLAEEVGNSVKSLEHPEILPLFIGIILGILLGSVPLTFPGISAPLKLGLAGGPLIVALVLSRIGQIGSLQIYMPHSANLMLREIGIVLFLACVGLKAGNRFIPTLIDGGGFLWMGYGALITFLPLVMVAFFARLALKKNYLEICGLLSGSMTDPPALAFAGSFTASDAPAITYATVYPLVTFLRIMAAQLLVLFFPQQGIIPL